MKVKKATTIALLSFVTASFFELLFLLASPPSYKLKISDIRMSYFLYLLLICAVGIYFVQRYQIVNKIKSHYHNTIYTIRNKYPRLIKTAVAYMSVIIISFIIEFIIHKCSINSHFNIYQFFFFTTIGFIIVTGFKFWELISKKPENVYLILCLCIGITFASSLPVTMLSWDDPTHFANAMHLSYFNGTAVQTQADLSLEDLTTQCTYKINEVAAQHLTEDKQYNNVINTVRTGLSPVKQLLFLYAQIGYVPSAIGLFLGRLLHMPFYIIVILGRVFNLLSYAIITFFAMKRLKAGKMILAAIAMFPTNIFLSCNYSYDPWVTAWAMLGTAYFIGAMQRPDEIISIKECIIMIGAFFIGLGPKAIYILLFAMLLLIPNSKFKTQIFQRRFRIYVCVTASITLATFMLPFLIQGPGTGDARGGADVNSALQVRFILNHPIQYIGILFNFLKTYLSFDNMNNYITNFAYIGVTPGFLLTVVLLAFVMFTDHCKNDKIIVNGKMKLFFSIIVLATASLIATALYISFTAVGSNTVLGCQARYLLPLVFPILFVWGSHKIENQINKSVYNSIVLGTSSLILLIGIWKNCIRLYS